MTCIFCKKNGQKRSFLREIRAQTFYYPIYGVTTACCVPWQSWKNTAGRSAKPAHHNVIDEQPLTKGSVLVVQQVNLETMVSPISCGLMSCFPNSNKEAPFQSGFKKFLKIKSSLNARSCAPNVNLTRQGNILDMTIWDSLDLVYTCTCRSEAFVHYALQISYVNLSLIQIDILLLNHTKCSEFAFHKTGSLNNTAYV